MRFSISKLFILAIAALFTFAAAVDIEARQTPAPPVTPVPTPTSTVKSTLDPSQSAFQSMEDPISTGVLRLISFRGLSLSSRRRIHSTPAP
ncbi:hypothetical protein DID88_007909 [Monilinia fructigena]|uniref:Uncharacterized protein n=1 Tax=Monilinia fructigena TaxID=38457 RepID=A0A395J451_9HELO|nr:hypothetical protein DID88_007909 [Monilinia fructigena]